MHEGVVSRNTDKCDVKHHSINQSVVFVTKINCDHAQVIFFSLFNSRGQIQMFNMGKPPKKRDKEPDTKAPKTKTVCVKPLMPSQKLSSNSLISVGINGDSPTEKTKPGSIHEILEQMQVSAESKGKFLFYLFLYQTYIRGYKKKSVAHYA